MLRDQLKNLGLGDHEAEIYAILLINSPASATFLAKRCRLSRSSVYTALNSLSGKGLVGTSYKNEIKQFVAEDFESIRQLVKAEEERIKQKRVILDKMELEIKALTKSAINIPEIMVFEGQDGLKKIYLSMLRQAQTNSTMFIIRDEFVWQKQWNFIFGKEWHERVKRLRQEKNIHTKMLVNNSFLEKSKLSYYNSRKGLVIRRLANRQAVKEFAIYILDDTLSILSMENNNLVGIKIVNRHLADNYKILFENLWNAAKK